MPTPIAKKDLVKGTYYFGRCRNTNIALWTGKEFKYYRYKMGGYTAEDINHYEDDNGYDLFYPLKEIKE